RSSFGTYGVGEFLSDPEKMRVAFAQLRRLAPGHTLPKNFVVLLKIEINEGIPVRVEDVFSAAPTSDPVQTVTAARTLPGDNSR
ncbi:MAG: hypothetical protein JOZ22_06950, partial [Acidobacteriia bacterium]|nr:hypothetical protein [Terriglobia bacterium]